MRASCSFLLVFCCTSLFGQPAASVRFTYAVTGKPAAGMTVEMVSVQPPTRYTTDSAGRVPVALTNGRVRVTDPQTGVMLLDRGVVRPTPELAIAIPVRLTGQVTGFGTDPTRIEIDCGHGERMAVSDYQRVY